MNHELAALRSLATAIAERLSVEIMRRMDLGHGRTDADPAALTALIALQQDASDAREVASKLHRHPAAINHQQPAGVYPARRTETMTSKTVLYDFRWDDDARRQAVWCQLGGVETCVEAVLFHPGDAGGADWHASAEHLGEYRLASDITLRPGDGVVVGDAPSYGSAARAHLKRLQKIEVFGKQIN